MVVAPVVEDRDTPAGAQDARDLGDGGDGVEPVERLATNTASTAPSGRGMDSAVPGNACAAGATRESTARMPSSGSTAVTIANRPTSSRVSLPVPAARSSTAESGVRPRRETARSIASPDQPGRPRS